MRDQATELGRDPGAAPRPGRDLFAWVALAVLLVAGGMLLLPRLETRFRFRDLFAPGHPAREAYEDYLDNFGEGSRVFLYFHGPEVFGARFLDAVYGFGNELRRMPGTGGVLSAAELREPDLAGHDQLLVRILREEVLASPERLEAALQGAPFREHLHGFLYDRDLHTLVVVVTPPGDSADPREGRRYMRRLEKDARAFARTQGVEVYLAGDFYLRQEVRRVAIESQARLALAAFAILAVLLGVLFASPVLVLQFFFLLAASVYVNFLAMAALGIPVTFLSVNTAVMVLVIGTADLVHIAGRYAAARRELPPAEAAARARRETAVPVLLTSLTTAGCLLITAGTPLNLVRQFSLALAAGVMGTWALAVTYGPRLLARSGLEPDRGLYFPIQDALGRGMQGGLRARVEGRFVPLGFAVVGLASLVLLADQRVDSNWLRAFGPEAPMSHTLAFLAREGLPRSTVDCTLRVDRRLVQALEDPGLARDAAKIAAALERQVGVIRVEHLYTQQDYVQELIATVRYPDALPEVWREARRQALLRQYLTMGTFQRYFGDERHELRFVVLTGLESSREFLALDRAMRREVAALDLEVARPEDFQVTGQMHYWSAIMAVIPVTFLQGLAGCLVLIFLCFLAVTGSMRLAAVSLLPNLFPLIVMFGGGRLLGIPLNENLILAMSLAIGVAVDDTLHFLYHYASATRAGRAPRAAVQEAFVTAGAPIVVTSILLLAGFSVCLGSSITAMREMGMLLGLAISSALAADLLLLPALLLRFDAPRTVGSNRGYRVEPVRGAPTRQR